MKLGVFTVPLTGMSLDDACAWLAKKGVQMVEIGCGGCPGNAHCNAEELLADDEKCRVFLDTVARHGLQISALSAHGNMVHPDPAVAAAYERDFVNAILLAEKLGASITEMPVTIINHRASTVHVVRDSIRMVRDLIRIKKRVRRITFDV